MNTQPPDVATALIQDAVREATVRRRRLTMRAAVVSHVAEQMMAGGPPPRVSSAPAARPSPPSRRVLLVEDDDDFAASLVSTLEAAGYGVVRARGVPDAVRALAEEGFARAIVDFDLGEGFGNEVIEHARSANPDVQVVLMSGVVPELLPGIAAVVGVVDVLPKPFSPEDLLLTLGPAPSAPAASH